LSLARLVETRPELEEAVALWLGGDTSTLNATIEKLAREGPHALSLLVDIVTAQIAAYPDRSAFEPLQQQVAEAVLRALAAPKSAIDHRAAMQSALAASRTLGAGLTKDALYPGLRMGIVGSNAFTNEPGFPKLVAKAKVDGGAAIGVGGAIFDLGSTGSDLIISVDANPFIRETIHLFTAILLAVDKKGGGADEVLAWLERGPNAETTEAMRALGVPDSLLERLDEHLTAFSMKLKGYSVEAHPIPIDLWCRGEKRNERIAHLTRLALEGRILAVTADLADPTLSDRIDRLLAAHNTKAQVVHLSNTLDYVRDVAGVLKNMGAFARNPSAIVSTCVGINFRNAVHEAMPDDYYLVDELGTLMEPKIHPAKDWLGDTMKARALHEMVHQTGPHLRQLDEYERSIDE